MSTSFRSAKCISCGADLQVSADQETFYCQFCGTKQTLQDDHHHRYTYRNVDDARIREADVQQAIRLKELDIELLRMQNETRHKRFGLWMRLFALIAYFLILAGLLFLPTPEGSLTDLRPWLIFYIPFGIIVFRIIFKKEK